MEDFPDFMKHSANKSQETPGVEGYVFDGADGSQMAFWTCRETAASMPHVHPYLSRLKLPTRSPTTHALCSDGRAFVARFGERYSESRGSQMGANESLMGRGARPLHNFEHRGRNQ